MDLIPLPPSGTNKVNSANMSGDGGSKSNTGYFRNDGEAEEKQPDQLDEVSFSHSKTDDEKAEINIDKTLFNIIKKFLNKIKSFILKLYKPKIKIQNIYK